MDDGEASRLQLGSELRADVVEEDGGADVDGVAGEAEGVGLGDADAPGFGVAGLDLLLRWGVEGGWVVHEVAVGERAEAGVEVIEAGVDEAEGDDLDAPETG